MKQTQRTHHKAKVEEEVEHEEPARRADLSKTDEVLDEIEQVLEDQEKIEFKEKLRRWSKNQKRLSPTVELYGSRYGPGDGNCGCCGLPTSGPPGPECLRRFLEGMPPS